MAKKPNQKPVGKPVTRKLPVNSPGIGDHPYFDYFAVATILLLIFILRIPYLEIALERDEASYAYIGKRALEGLTPYRDFYEMKPPLLFYVYALIDGVFGYSAKGLHVALLVINMLNTLLVYGISRLLLNKSAGAVAAVAYIILAFNPMVSGLWMVSEHALMTFALAGILAFIKGLQQPKWLFTAGILFACSILIKQVAGVFGLWAGIVLLIRHFEATDASWKKLFRQWGILAAGAIIPVALTLILISSLGVWKEFMFWMFEYPSKYMDGVQSTAGIDVFGFQWKRNTDTYLLYWLAGAFGMIALFFAEKQWTKKAGLALLALLSFATILPGSRYYGHYWLQFFPALAICFGAGVFAVQRWFKGSVPGLIMGIFFLAAISHLLIYQQNYFNADRERLVRAAYPGNPFVEHKKMADYLNTRLKPEDKLMVLGSEPQFYIYTNKKSPGRHFYTGFTSREIPEARLWQQETLADLRKSQPDYVVFSTQRFSWMMKEKSDQTLYQESYKFINQYYTPVAIADIISPNETKLVFDAEAVSYQRSSQEFIMIMQKKK